MVRRGTTVRRSGEPLPGSLSLCPAVPPGRVRPEPDELYFYA